jgi:hypothetical protein
MRISFRFYPEAQAGEGVLSLTCSQEEPVAEKGE